MQYKIKVLTSLGLIVETSMQTHYEPSNEFGIEMIKITGKTK